MWKECEIAMKHGGEVATLRLPVGLYEINYTPDASWGSCIFLFSVSIHKELYVEDGKRSVRSYVEELKALAESDARKRAEETLQCLSNAKEY